MNVHRTAFVGAGYIAVKAALPEASGHLEAAQELHRNAVADPPHSRTSE